MTFYHPTDGYLYGWEWGNGDEAWWSTEDLALRSPRDIAGRPGKPIRRRYVIGEVEDWEPGETTPELAEQADALQRVGEHLRTDGCLVNPPEPYEQAMLDELRAMTWSGPVTVMKIQRRLRVGFGKAQRLYYLYREQPEAAS